MRKAYFLLGKTKMNTRKPVNYEEEMENLKQIAKAELEGLKRQQLVPWECNQGDDPIYIYCATTVKALETDPKIGESESWSDEFNKIYFEIMRLTDNISLFYSKKYLY